MNAKDYIYIDEKGIDSIYSQLCGEALDEVKITKTNSHEGEIDASASISSILEIITGQGELTGKISGSTGYEGRLLISYEQKIDRIINACKKDPAYFTDLTAAIARKRTSKNEMILINISDTFRPKLNFSSSDSFSIAKDRGYLEFEKGKQPLNDRTRAYDLSNDTYNYGDDYYKQKNDDYILLAFNLDKLRTSFGISSHMGIALRACAKENGHLQMGILGTLRMIDEHIFQIKAYAVWM